MFPTRRITMGGDVFRDEFSLAFDGSNDHVLTTFQPDYIHANATFAMWIKMNDLSGSQVMGSHSSKRWYFGFKNTNAFIGVANNATDTITITPTPVAGQWLHYAVTAIDGTATVYINGIAQSTTMSYVQSSSTNPVDGFTIGARNNGGTMQSLMNANISEVVQYDKGLSASEVKTLYNDREPYNHKEGVCSSNLKAWWRMGDGALDSKQNSHTNTGIVSDETNPTLGSDLLAGKGDFSDASYWSTVSGQSIVENNVGKFLGNGSYNAITKSEILTVGKIYRCQLDCTANSGTAININQTSFFPQVVPLGQTGTHFCFFKPTGTTFTLYAPENTYGETATIDNVIVQEVNGNAGALINLQTTSCFEGDTP